MQAMKDLSKQVGPPGAQEGQSHPASRDATGADLVLQRCLSYFCFKPWVLKHILVFNAGEFAGLR